MATIYHIVLPQRQLRHDYTYTYEFVLTDFTMAKPSLSSNWQSLYDPLTDEVWASVMVALLLVPFLLFMVCGVCQNTLYLHDIIDDAPHVYSPTYVQRSIHINDAVNTVNIYGIHYEIISFISE